MMMWWRNTWVWVVAVLLLVAVFYAPAIRLPFFSDDIPTQRYLTQATLGDIFTKIDMNGTYYRPFANLFYKYVPLDSVLWHSIMIWAHLLNTALLGAFMRALGVGAGGRIVAMALWGVFPFSVQAILWVGAGFHVLLVMLVMLACVCALRFWARPTHRAWLGVAWVAGFLAPFAHETGILAFALVALALWMRMGWGVLAHWWRALVLLAPMLAGAVFYTLIRQAIVGGSAGFLREAPEIIHNIAFFGQGFGLPLQFLAGLLEGDAVLRALLASGLWVGGMMGLAWRAPVARRRVLGAIGWAGVSLAPAYVLLHPAYVGYGERLAMVAVPSMVLVAAVLWERLPRALGMVWLVPTLVACVLFGREYVRLHSLHGDAFQTLFADLRDEDNTARHLFVNLPSHIERTHTTLPLARAHAGLFTDWVALVDFLWLNTGGREWRQSDALYTPDLIGLWDGYWQRFWGYSTVDMYTAAQRFGEVDKVWRNHNDTPQHTYFDALGERLIAPARPPLATYADALAIEGVRLRMLPDGRGQVAIDWRVTGALDAHYTAFVHWLCDGELVAQSDGDLFDNLYAFNRVDVGAGWRDFRYSPPIDAACLGVRVGVYDRNTGIPLANPLEAGAE